MGDKPAIEPNGLIGEALKAVAHAILAAALTAVRDTERPDAVAVHDFRRTMKQWRALLRLLDPFLGDIGRRLQVEARDLARSLSGARDLQAALDALEDLYRVQGSTEQLSARSFATMRARIVARRADAESVALPEGQRTRLAAALEGAAAVVDYWPLEALGFPDIARRLAETYGRARRAIPDTLTGQEGETLHDLRRRAIAHRYQMELIVPLWPRLGKLWVGEAQRLRDRLGQYQDLEVLETLTAPRQLLAPWRSRLVPMIAARQDAHARAAERIARRLFAETPKAFRRRIERLWDAARGAERPRRPGDDRLGE